MRTLLSRSAPDQPTPTPVGPPTKPQQALMIWLCVVPTLIVLTIVLGPWIMDVNPMMRMFVLATLTVPTMVYVEMPLAQRARVWILSRRRRRG